MASYIRIYYFIRQHELEIRAQQQAVQNSDAENNLNVPRLKRSAMNTFVFCVALIICYFPVYVLSTVYVIFQKGVRVFHRGFQTREN